VANRFSEVHSAARPAKNQWPMNWTDPFERTSSFPSVPFVVNQTGRSREGRMERSGVLAGIVIVR
jgi:hypothetical protein